MVELLSSYGGNWTALMYRQIRQSDDSLSQCLLKKELGCYGNCAWRIHRGLFQRAPLSFLAEIAPPGPL